MSPIAYAKLILILDFQLPCHIFVLLSIIAINMLPSNSALREIISLMRTKPGHASTRIERLGQVLSERSERERKQWNQFQERLQSLGCTKDFWFTAVSGIQSTPLYDAWQWRVSSRPSEGKEQTS